MNVLIRNLSQQEQLNFLLTNRVPRRLLTRFIGWYSKIENPLLARLSISLWKLFAPDLDLSESSKQSFSSLQDCFIRRLKPGTRTIDYRENIVTSPCDAIIGAKGTISSQTVYQAKGFPYELADLIPDSRLCHHLQNGQFITLRLKSSMYHRFHAPVDCQVQQVTYISGDTWNVNPVALKRIEKLFCKNERAVIQLHGDNPEANLVLVPVAAILVASMKFHCLNEPLDMKYQGPNNLVCNANYRKGEEMGYFQHGSTIILFAPPGYQLLEDIDENRHIRMGEPLMKKISTANL